MKRYFAQEDIWMENQHKKIFNIIRYWEMQIKTTMSYCYISIRKAKIKIVTISNADEEAEKNLSYIVIANIKL